jgi:uncharacterized protein DUF4389
MTHPPNSAYPLRLEGDLTEPLSRWLWLVKWILVIPHGIVLFFLWIGGAVVWLITLFAILFTARYPRWAFDYMVGVMRWTWRVMFYTYNALGTDRYPPFSFQDDPDYPARLDVRYPEALSRGLVLVKWWLLAIPQYIVTAIFAGGAAATFADQDGGPAWLANGGLIGVLVLISAIVLLFTGRYPKSIYDFVMGMNRWVWRVCAYALLMTDDYPPFRLDMGEREDAEAAAESHGPEAAPA